MYVCVCVCVCVCHPWAESNTWRRDWAAASEACRKACGDGSIVMIS